MKNKLIKKAFDRLEGCIEYDGNGKDLVKKIRRNEEIILKSGKR